MVDDKEKLHKLQVNITKKALEDIDEMRERIDAGSRTEVIKSSLKFFNFITKEKKEDKDLKILLTDSKGNTRELII